MNEQRTINIIQAAEYLGCSKSFIYRLYRMGKIDGYRLGEAKGLRFYLQSVKAYLNERYLA